MKKVSIFFLFLLAPSFLFSSAQRFMRFERILPYFNTVPLSVVSSILQDREGFLWFGTDKGLAKYDGYHFTLFTPPQSGREPSFWPISVFPMIEDSRGDIWFGTNGHGLFRFARQNEEFIPFTHDPENPVSLAGNTILSLQEDKSGDLYVGTRSNGLCRYDRQNNTFTKISLGENIETIWVLLIDSQNHIWAGTQDSGLFRFDPETRKIRNYKHDTANPNSIGSNTVWSIFQDKQGTIWVGTKNGGLNRLDEESEGFTAYFGNELEANDLRHSNIISLCEDRTGNIWAGTQGDGLRIFDKKTERFTAYKHIPNDPDSLSGNHINALYQDSSGIMWVATQRGGINKSLNDQVKFKHFKHNPFDPQSISDSDVRSVYKNESGFLWIGTSGGLEKIDEKSGETIHFLHDPADAASISAGSVQTVLEDEDGMIWTGLDKTGLNRLDPGTGIFTHYNYREDSKNSLSHNRVHVIRQDRNNKDILWIGTQNGLNKFNKKTGHFIRFFASSEPSTLSSSHITSISEDRSGDLWVGTVGGLNRMDKRTGHFTRFATESSNPQKNTLLDNHVTSLLEDRKGIMWIGTLGGISKYDRASEKWKHYTTREGLPGDIICGILEDETGCLWISSNRGLLKLDPETENITTYGLYDGIQAQRFNRGAFFKTSEGQMFFGGVTGYNSFDPKDIKKNPYIPPVVWTGFYILNKKFDLGQPLSSLKELRLYSEAGFITFEFAALCFLNPERNQFAFKLEGRDKEWTYTGPNRTLSFPSSLKKKYILHVKAANPDGVWNEKGLSIPIQMIPPFWKTWWFITSALAVALFIILSWMRTRAKLRTAQKVKKENLEKVFKKHNITQREQEIITMILDGANNKDIEKKLYISSSTVRNHIYNIYQKLGIQNRIELVNLIKKQP